LRHRTFKDRQADGGKLHGVVSAHHETSEEGLKSGVGGVAAHDVQQIGWRQGLAIQGAMRNGLLQGVLMPKLRDEPAVEYLELKGAGPGLKESGALTEQRNAVARIHDPCR
jgi:hypothetical protein